MTIRGIRIFIGRDWYQSSCRWLAHNRIAESLGTSRSDPSPLRPFDNNLLKREKMKSLHCWPHT